ncbi:MAG: TIGR00725 family protein [Chloroflexi bacterium]|nr:TIGR00725 family protein [Chloroflexota bacterium]
MIIAVVGSGTASDELCALAEEVGREVARQGAVLITGGLGGVMAAASRGAHEEGGITVGILPGTDPKEANPWVEIPIATGMGQARNVIIVTAAHAVVAVGGEYGTLSEIAHALKIGKPVIGLRTWTLAKEFAEQDENIIAAFSPIEAVNLAVALAKE